MARGIYVGVNGAARKARQIYVGVNGVARKVRKIYVGVGGVAKLCYEAGGVPAGNLPLGSVVKFPVGGTVREFLVIHKGKPSGAYDDSCNGIWLLTKDSIEKRAWHSSEMNDYANSDIHTYLNGGFFNAIDPKVRGLVKQVKIPYRAGPGIGKAVKNGANGLSCYVFLLSYTEVGGTSTTDWPVEGAKLDYFEAGTGDAAKALRVANFDGAAAPWWLRTPSSNPTTVSGAENRFVARVRADGDMTFNICTSATTTVRPALLLPEDALVDSGTGEVIG